MVARRWTIAVLAACAIARAGAARAAATVFVVDDDVRLRRADTVKARLVGQALAADGGQVARVALRGETIAFQVIVVADAAPVREAVLAVADLVGPDGARLRTAVFREHYLHVDRRSRNDRVRDESLGWRPGARATDADMLGDVPDALLPLAVDSTRVMPPPAVPADALGAFWVDVEVPDGSPPGRYAGVATVKGDGAVLARFAVAVDVRPTPLPFRAASVFIYYEAERLATRMGHGGDGDGAGAIERQLWQVLHAHHIDALAPLLEASDVERLAKVYDGTLFTEAAGYLGPGAGLPPAVVALGTYGDLGEPTPGVLARVDAMVTRLPAGLDLFLYAIDESCKSPRAGDWQRALADHPPPRPLAVAQTCDDPPAEQSVDIAMLSAGGFTRATPAEARAAGRRAFIYNGILPAAGALMLDVDPRGLIANGWIAATMAIERWFYWESIFWDDSNRGGQGPIDPFVTAASFHNADGDTALSDGLLLYPGRQQGRFAASSLGEAAVFPSLRLKAIRRGIQDAGLIALAAREHPEETAALVARALPAALDEAAPRTRASWEAAPLSFTAGREALLGLIADPQPLPEAGSRAAFADLAVRRAKAVPLAHQRDPMRVVLLLVVGLLFLGSSVWAHYRRRRPGGR